MSFKENLRYDKLASDRNNPSLLTVPNLVFNGYVSVMRYSKNPDMGVQSITENKIMALLILYSNDTLGKMNYSKNLYHKPVFIVQKLMKYVAKFFNKKIKVGSTHNS